MKIYYTPSGYKVTILTLKEYKRLKLKKLEQWKKKQLLKKSSNG